LSLMLVTFPDVMM